MWIHKILLRKEILLKSPSIQLKSPSSQLKSPSAKALSEVKDPTTKGSTNNCIASAAQDIADFICIVDNITNNLLSKGKELPGSHFNCKKYIKPLCVVLIAKNLVIYQPTAFTNTVVNIVGKIIRSYNLDLKNISVWTALYLDTHLHHGNVQNT